MCLPKQFLCACYYSTSTSATGSGTSVHKCCVSNPSSSLLNWYELCWTWRKFLELVNSGPVNFVIWIIQCSFWWTLWNISLYAYCFIILWFMRLFQVGFQIWAFIFPDGILERSSELKQRRSCCLQKTNMVLSWFETRKVDEMTIPCQVWHVECFCHYNII